MKKLAWRFGAWSLLMIGILALPAPAQEKPEKARVAVATSSMAFLVPFIAKDRGFYLKQGAEVELIQMRPNIAVAALLSGDIDKSPFFSVIAQNKFKSVKDLKGATIGIASIGGTNHISTRLTLKEFGLDPEKDVKLIAIGDEKLIYDAFKIGRTEAVVLAPPYSIQLKREGFPILANTAQYVTIPFSGLGTTLDRIKSNRAQIKKLLKAEIEALRYLRDNPAGTVEVIRKRFSMDDKTAQESYDVVVDAFSRDGRVPLDGVDILLQIEKDQKLIPTTVTPKMVVDASLVEEALKELGGK